MKSLSIWTYYLNNKRKVIPVLIIIVISIIGLMAPPALFKSVKNDIVEGFEIYHKYIIGYLNESESNGFTAQELSQQLNSIHGINHIIESQVRYTQRYAISGDLDTPVYFLNEKDYSSLLNHLGLSLTEGSYPKINTNEVIITTKLATNKKLIIGDKFGYAIDTNDTIPGEFIVSGLIESNAMPMGIGNLDFINQKKSLLTFYLIAPETDQEASVINSLNQLKQEHNSLSFDSFDSLYDRMNFSFGSLDQMFNILTAIIVVVISTSIALLQIIFFMQRANEYGLLAAIGYSRKFIIRKSMAEITFIIIFGWILGLVGTCLIFMAINNSLYTPKAYTPLNLLDPYILSYSLPIPIVISMFSIIPILWQLVKMDPISIIERRD